MQSSLIAVFIGLNLLSFIVYGMDKLAAIKEWTRVRERNLLLLSFFGPVGALPGIYLLRHKNRKRSYQLKLLPVLMLSVLSWIFILHPSYWQGLV